MSLRALLAAAALLIFSSASYANLAVGRDYNQLRTPQPVEVKGKTEVIEFFSFACPGCYQIHRRIMAWARKLPGDVNFRRVAIAFDKPGWAPLARAFYALEATGDLNKVDTALFDAIHQERKPLFDEKSITDWMAAHGVDRAKFTAAYNSFGVNTRVAQNTRTVMSYEIGAVPSIVVDGRYSVNAQTFDEMLVKASELIEKVKAERAGKKS